MFTSSHVSTLSRRRLSSSCRKASKLACQLASSAPVRATTASNCLCSADSSSCTGRPLWVVTRSRPLSLRENSAAGATLLLLPPCMPLIPTADCPPSSPPFVPPSWTSAVAGFISRPALSPPCSSAFPSPVISVPSPPTSSCTVRQSAIALPESKHFKAQRSDPSCIPSPIPSPSPSCIIPSSIFPTATAACRCWRSRFTRIDTLFPSIGAQSRVLICATSSLRSLKNRRPESYA